MSGELKRISKMATTRFKFTPKLRAWLAGHPEGVGIETEEEAELVLRLLATPEEGSRAGAFHPSGLTRCPREQVFSFHGAPRTGHSFGSQLQNIFIDGTWRHARWQLMLMKLGILHSVEVQVGIPELRLKGSMDGQGTDDNGEEWFFELKGTSKSLATVEAEGPSPEYYTQVQAYLMASGLEQAVMVYEQKSYQDWIEIEVPADPEVHANLRGLLEELNAHVDNDTLPPMLSDCWRKSGVTYVECPYAVHCHEKERSA